MFSVAGSIGLITLDSLSYACDISKSWGVLYLIDDELKHVGNTEGST